MNTDRDQYFGAMFALAGKLSRDGYKGCKQDGDVENCLTWGCPCAAAATYRGAIDQINRATDKEIAGATKSAEATLA